MADEIQQFEIDEKIARRIESEKQYHKRHYTKTNASLPVNFALATSVRRKPHNLTWLMYDTVLDHFQRDLTGKRILVVGCGEGSTALNFAKSGFSVDAFDLSEEAIEVCKRRAAYNGIDGVNFFVSSCEELRLVEGRYDAVVGEMILHHIDIPTCIKQFHRLLKFGGAGVFAEWKVYPIIDHIRSLPLLNRLFPPGGVRKYATEFERKLSKEDLQIIKDRFPNTQLEYRYCIRGKIDYFSPSYGDRSEKLDFFLLRTLPFLKYFTDGVVMRFTKADGGQR